jgi:phospho-N-acetylmuramoyl-pentapeptide-transferase
MILDIVKVMVPATAAFFLGIALTPFLTHYLYKYKAWKKHGGKVALDGTEATEFNKLHQVKETGTPRMGGIVVWGSAVVTILGIWLLAHVAPSDTTEKFDFLSRNQTWIPLFTLITGAIVGLIDDLLNVTGKTAAAGLSLPKRLLVVSAIAFFIASWFYYKLDISGIGIPFNGTLDLGVFFIPCFILVTLVLYAGGIIDGIDGLSGGVFAAIFSAYAGIAFYQLQIDLAAFCATLVGAILAFLWFNIPPARFYMTETGTMGLTVTLAAVAFMTDSLGEGVGVSVLPIIAFPLFITVASNILQVASKKLRKGKKLFRVAPLHHHFEAIGWPGYKVTMRYWVLSVIFALIGLIVALIG